MKLAFELAHPKLLYESASLSVSFIIPSILQIVLYFVLLGICASEYLCPSVANLSDPNGRHAGVLTAVLLSWCNSSPDLFSNFMSWTNRSSLPSSDNAAALSVGEVLGACGIILCIVEGSIFMIMASIDLNITYSQRSMVLRDLGFAFVAMLFMWYICLMNKVTISNCIVMIVFYAVYLVSKFKFKGTKNEAYMDEELPYELTAQLSEENDSFTNRIKPSLISAMDFNNLLSMLETSSGSKDLEEFLTIGDNFPSDNSAHTPIRAATEPPITDRYYSIPEAPQSSPPSLGAYSDIPDGEFTEVSQFNMQRKSKSRQRISKYKRTAFRLFLPHLLNFSKKSTMDAILSIITTPFVILLRFSCPQPIDLLDFDDGTKHYTFSNNDMLMMLIQSLLCPIVSFFIISCIIEKEIPFSLWIIPIAISSCLVLLTVIFYKTLLSHNKFSILSASASSTSPVSTNFSQDRRTIEMLENFIKIVFLTLSIINSILWISMIANALIEMLEIYQQLTGVSEAILGLTIFAWGNSISDLISNIAMCKLYRKIPQTSNENMANVATKFFIISCSSCIGGVLLNSMGGIGVSGLFSMLFVHKGSSKWWFYRYVDLIENSNEYDAKFMISCVAILLQLSILGLVFGGPTTLRNWFLNRKFGLGLSMCSIWGVATFVNIFVETVG